MPIGFCYEAADLLRRSTVSSCNGRQFMYKKLFVIGVLAVLYGFVLSACSDDEPASITGQDQTGDEKADKPRLAMNSGGYALTVWEQENVSGTKAILYLAVLAAGRLRSESIKPMIWG